MKNLTKKILTVLFAVLMVFANTISASAEVDQKKNNTELTISGLEKGGETIDLYQLATATYNADGDNLDALTLDSKLTEGNALVEVQAPTYYVDGDERPAGKEIGDEKTPRITMPVSAMPVNANGKLTNGNVTYKDSTNTEKTFAFNPATAPILNETTGVVADKNIDGKFPLSTGSTASDGPSEKQISAIAADIAANPTNWTSNKKAVDGTVDTSGKKWTVTAYAAAKDDIDPSVQKKTPAIYEATGIYLGKVNPVDDTVYNPVIVSVGYKTDGNNNVNYQPSNIAMTDKYFAPSVALKKSTPGVVKSVTGGKNENFPICVVATDLNDNPIYKDGLVYVPPTGNTPTGTSNLDPDKMMYVKKTINQDTNELYSAGEVLDFIHEALRHNNDYRDYITDEVEDAYTVQNANNLTGSLGTKFDYELKPTLPSYPENAVNKTLWFSDKMSDGLDYVDGSLTVTLASGKYVEKTYDKDNTDKQYTFYVYEETEFEAGVYELDGTEYKVTTDTVAAVNKTYYKKVKLAEAKDNSDGFNINYNYDAIPEADRKQVENTSGLIMKYQAVINKNAFVGVKGNPNAVTMVYSNEPDKGNTHDNLNEPSDKGNKRKYDEEIVYTYRIQFKKVDEKTGAVLEGAVFGLYANEVITYSDADSTKVYAENELVSTLSTNAQGMGVTTQVVPGKYYLKEISAPKGYQLNKEKYEFEVKAEDAVTKVTTSSSSSWEYTTDKTKSINYSTTNQDPAIDGYLVNSNFYEIVDYPTSSWTYTAPPEPNTTGAKGTLTNSTTGQVIYDVLPAYISKEDHVNHGTVTVDLMENKDPINRGWIHVQDIKNTKTPELPSTGGIGTYLFTIAGVAIIATAAFMLIFRKKEGHTH